MLERKKINNYLEQLLNAYVFEDFTKIKKIEKKLSKIINKFPELDKEKKQYILKLANRLVKIENDIILYIQDKNLDSLLLIDFNNLFLKNNIDIKNKDNLETLRKLIIINLNAKKLITYEKIMEKYFEYFDLETKIMVIKDVLGNNSGKLSLKIIDSISKEISSYNFKLPEDLNLIANIANISRNMMIELDIEEIIYKSFEYANSREWLMEKVIYFMQEMQNHIKYINQVNNWILKYANMDTNKILKNRMNIMVDIMNQQSGKYSNKKIKYFNNPENYAAELYDISLMQSDFSKSKKYVYNYANNVLDKWKKEIVNNKKIDEQINQLAYVYKLNNLIRYIKYHSLFNQELNKVAYADKVSKEIILFVNDFSIVNASIALPLLIQLKKDGYFISGTSPYFIEHHLTNDQELNNLTNIMLRDIDRNLYKTDLIDFDFEIDIKNKKIMINNFNVYQPIYEVVSRYQFTYFFHFETDAWARAKVYNLILYFKRIFDYCDLLYDYALKNNKKIRFISNAPHIPHAGSYRIYCEEKGYKANMEFVVLSPGYDNYFKNVGDALTETIAALNMNKNPNSRNAFLGTSEGFNNFYNRESKDIKEYRDIAKKYLSYNRSHKKSESKEKNAIIQKIESYKNQGKKIILVNGKVVFDLGVKYTKGLCHDDMSDWLTHTVEIAKNDPNILLIIKPHPHEQRKDLTMTDEQVFSFKDLVKTSIDSPNIIYLKPNLFKNDELLKYVDLGIVWNGTSSMEFLAQGIKTLAMDDWALKDYPVGLKNITTKKEYEEMK